MYTNLSQCKSDLSWSFSVGITSEHILSSKSDGERVNNKALHSSCKDPTSSQYTQHKQNFVLFFFLETNWLFFALFAFTLSRLVTARLEFCQPTYTSTTSDQIILIKIVKPVLLNMTLTKNITTHPDSS